MNRIYTIVRTDLPGADLSMHTEHLALKSYENVKLQGVICCNDEEVIYAAKNADVLITNESFINRHVLCALERVRAIVRYGIGFDRVDLDAATEYGIAVVNIPDFCLTELAQYVIMGILAWNKQLIRLNASVKMGQWIEARSELDERMGATVGQTLGIYGYGNAGREVARLASCLGMQVITCSKHLTDQDVAMGVRYVSRDDLFRNCDFLSINCALNERTRHTIGAQEFALMKKTAVLINTARGAVIDEASLIHALETEEIAGAVLDVLESEPPNVDNPLLKMQNVIQTPHTSFYSVRSSLYLSESVIKEAIRCILPGEKPLHVVNPEVLKRDNCRILHRTDIF